MEYLTETEHSIMVGNYLWKTITACPLLTLGTI